ncbi:NusG domain II-containing protein [Anaerocolumna aminovalerica]|jgi:hypothetical protein|uniref:Uncharacterized protein n=1 Tax=Anaerocolumna aminovalerica TaxID=1527 RepID=A0A1I5HD83_9FIRM|nr:NusG domain II-containing protein [Anaerocolumna aminovalerica]MDU6265285.1 NusG domain II-containing protein [Anaerocolumna aminovalerica]SFO46177.1 hypothetical protein SAMN04489757_12843 [Anaerocolumna aminovalerica]
MKKNDLILAGVILTIAIGALIFVNLNKKEGNTVIVKVDGEVYKEFPLDVDATYEIKGANGGTNLLVIKDGYADITEASCPDEVCVVQPKINKSGETIVCLPNKVIIEINGENQSELDAIAN